MTRLSILIVNLFFISATKAQVFMPGNTYYGRKNYTEYHAGNSPLIFSAPHGGSVSPSVIPDRTCNSPVLVADANTSDLAMRIDSACMIVFGCHPHIVICNMSRKKVDCNRPEPEGTCGNSEADIAWQDFHSFLDTASQTVMAQYGKGFYIDLHGHGHAIQRLEMGYLIHGNELRMSDTILNKAADTLRFSMHNLWLKNKMTISLSQLIRGPASLGTQLAQKGYPAVPSQQDPFPQASDPYFDGGYNTDRYSSAQGGTIDGLQIEHNFTGVRDTYHNRAVYADTLVKVLKAFLLQYYFNPQTLASCRLVTGDENMIAGKFPPLLFPNPSHSGSVMKFGSIQQWISVNIYDVKGTLVFSGKVPESGMFTIPAGNLSPGLYLILTETPSGRYFNKLQLTGEE